MLVIFRFYSKMFELTIFINSLIIVWDSVGSLKIKIQEVFYKKSFLANPDLIL